MKTPPPNNGGGGGGAGGATGAGALSIGPNVTLTTTGKEASSLLHRHFSVSDILFGVSAPLEGTELPSAIEYVVKSFCAEWLAQADAKLREIMMGGTQVKSEPVPQSNDFLIFSCCRMSIYVLITPLSNCLCLSVVPVDVSWA
jgi:hypothetical protein